MVGAVALAIWAVGVASVEDHRQDPRHPAAVAGEWVDLKHTTPTDSSIWVLAPNGDDQTVRVTGDERGWTSKRKHYGRWRLDGDLADVAGRRLCFVHRPGRQGGACIGFTVDVATTPTGPRRRLVLHGYQGEHTTGDRELFAR